MKEDLKQLVREMAIAILMKQNSDRWGSERIQIQHERTTRI
jgi:hypothetical protein